MRATMRAAPARDPVAVGRAIPRRARRWAAGVLGLGAILWATAAPGEPVRIMPLGDSITSAFNGHASYRYWLWKKLVAASYDVDFVGNEHEGVEGGHPKHPNFDQDHEGHAGWTADEVLARIAEWAEATRPDVVLVQLGSNDLEHGEDNGQTREELRQIIGELRAVNPHVAVLVAQESPFITAPIELQEELNEMIGIMADDEHRPESPVIAVDLWTGFTMEHDTYDWVHPNQAGEKKMADRFFEALVPLLGPAPGRPDAAIRRSGETAYTGGGRYGDDGHDQRRAQNAWPEQTRSFTVRVKNAGRATDTFVVHGPDGGDDFSVRYFDAESEEVTAEVVAGTYGMSDVHRGQSRTLRVEITPAPWASSDEVFDCLVTVRSERDDARLDAVLAVVAVK